MRINLILVTILVLFITNVNGQINLTSENHTPKPEYQYNFLSAKFDFASFKYAGEDTIWNIQNAVIGNDTLNRNFTRDSSFNSFPGYKFNPEICPNPSPEDTSLLRTQNAIYKTSSSELFQAYEVIFPPYIAPIDPYIGETYMPIFKFPFQYQDSIDAGSGILCHSEPYISRNTWRIADSYGTLKVKDTIYLNTLRVYTYYRYYKTLSIAHDFYEHKIHKYEWYNEDFHLSILSIEFSEKASFNGDNYTETFDTTAWLYNSNNYISPTSVDFFEFNNKKLDIFPNPAKTIISLKSNQALSGIRIVDLMGKSVLINNKNQLSEIDVSLFSKGVYIIYVHFHDGTYMSKKLIVTK